MNFKKKSRPFFIIIFKLKNGNFKTRDFSALIERVLAGVNGINFSQTSKFNVFYMISRFEEIANPNIQHERIFHMQM